MYIVRVMNVLSLSVALLLTERASEKNAALAIFFSERANVSRNVIQNEVMYNVPYRNDKGVWWMPRLQRAMKDVVWLR